MTASQDHPAVIARPPLLYGGALVLVLALRRLWPAPLHGDGILLWIGIAVCIVAIAFGMWGCSAMLAADTNIDPKRPSTAIVRSGPFRLTRNPLYVALTILFVGLTLALDTWWGFVIVVPLLIVMHRGVVLREERYLEQKFGDDYRQYKAGVARYLPLT